jgi:putative phosphoribosyl transferase
MTFEDRADAGRKVAERLRAYAHREDVLVLGMPRGGVPVAFEVAQALHAPLDVFLCRKLGVPLQEELAFGAIATGGVRVLDEQIVEAVALGPREIDEITLRERKELERRERVYRAGRPPLEVAGLTVILVDDGIATGASMFASVRALRQLKPARIVVAVPVAPMSTCLRLKKEVDELVCVHSPSSFYAIGQFYLDFGQLTDTEVVELLQRAASSPVPTEA